METFDIFEAIQALDPGASYSIILDGQGNQIIDPTSWVSTVHPAVPTEAELIAAATVYQENIEAFEGTEADPGVAVAEVTSNIGALDSLNTVNKTNLVAAINENVQTTGDNFDAIEVNSAAIDTNSQGLTAAEQGRTALAESITSLGSVVTGNIENIADLVTLSGLPAGTENLGTMPGQRVGNNRSVLQALAALDAQANEDWGTAFPAVVWPGREFYREDYAEKFFYDSSRSEWLSLTLRGFWLTANNDNDRLRHGNMQIISPNRDGFIWPYPVMVTRIYGNSRRQTNETGNVNMYRDGVTANSIPVTSDNVWDSGAISEVFQPGELLSANISGSQSGNWSRVSIYYTVRRIG